MNKYHILTYNEHQLLEQYSMNESEMLEAKKLANTIVEQLLKEHPEYIDEGFLSKLIGGTAGLIIGPTIGRVIAHTLGIEKGILYDLLSSKLVGVALGTAISKYLNNKN